MAIQGPTIEAKPAPAVATHAGRSATEQGEDAGRQAVAKQPVHTVPVQGDLREVQAAVAARLEKYLQDSGRSLEYRVDDAAHATVITVRRADTGEVVRQYPTEEALALLRRLNEESGTLLDAFA